MVRFQYCGQVDNYRMDLFPADDRKSRKRLWGELYYVQHAVGNSVYRESFTLTKESVEKILSEAGYKFGDLRWRVRQSTSYSYAPWFNQRYIPITEGEGIYFVRTETVSFVKIGWANNINERLGFLKTSSPYPLTLLFVIPGKRKQEREYHRRFDAYHAHLEWFRIEGKLEEFILNHS